MSLKRSHAVKPPVRIANLAYWVTGIEGSNPSLSAIESLALAIPRLNHRKARRSGLICKRVAVGERAATIYSLIGSAKLDPEAYLPEVLMRIADPPITHIEELLPWQIAASLPPAIEPAA